MHEIETKRLLHRQIEEQDKEDFYRLIKEPEVLRYCFDPLSEEDMETLYTDRLPVWDVDSKHWLCLVIKEKFSGDFVGVTGFVKTKNSAELGFMFLPKYFGQGLATESLVSLVEYSKHLGIAELMANITEGNIGSIRVVQKCGFRLFKTNIGSVSIGDKTYNNLAYKNVLQPIT